MKLRQIDDSSNREYTLIAAPPIEFLRGAALG